MLITSFGLGIALVSATVSVLTSAGEDDAGMLSGLNNTGHEIGGALGLAMLTTITAQSLGSAVSPGRAALATGLGHAFLAAASLAGVGLLLAMLLLPAAATFLPRLREAGQPVAIH